MVVSSPTQAGQPGKADISRTVSLQASFARRQKCSALCICSGWVASAVRSCSLQRSEVHQPSWYTITRATTSFLLDVHLPQLFISAGHSRERQASSSVRLTFTYCDHRPRFALRPSPSRDTAVDASTEAPAEIEAPLVVEDTAHQATVAARVAERRAARIAAVSPSASRTASTRPFKRLPTNALLDATRTG